ncbi:MAG: tRNA uridine-5-carboxymethylaminomethyl(34) synthesis GTPase MnmE [Bacteroidota bacterium]
MLYLNDDTICALSTAPGTAAIAVIRISGKEAFMMAEAIFSKTLQDKRSHTTHFGQIRNDEHIIDEVLISIFKGPASYTGEDTVEIACHGSPYIQQEILKLLIAYGCRMATAGEYSLRAFANGKMDLSQAEAVADLIASNSAASHTMAMHQMKGGFSKEIGILREKLIDFASLIELELDFAEEDVEFADRTALSSLLNEAITLIDRLIHSFSVGNVLKNGIPVAIVGAPNAGKSTLLNALLNEERAIVSNIAGTTRDAIEDEMIIDGIAFRFIDTAGIRDTTDIIENLGIEKTYEKARQARIILYLTDLTDPHWSDKAVKGIALLRELEPREEKEIIVLANKMDEVSGSVDTQQIDARLLSISAKNGQGIEELRSLLSEKVNLGELHSGQVIVTNTRHYEALLHARTALNHVNTGLNDRISGDLVAMDIRQALHHLGSITGQITTEDLLGSIFSRFCIGK